MSFTNSSCFSVVAIFSVFIGLIHSPGTNGVASSVVVEDLDKKSLPSVDEVVECIKNNEHLYKNIRYHYHCSMRLEKNSTFRSIGLVLDRFEQDIDFVRVNDLFKTVNRRSSVSVKGKPSYFDEISAYDGEIIFRMIGGKSVNVVLDPPVETDYYHPHAILGKEKFLMIHPLSNLIKGGDSMKKFPDAKEFDFSSKVVGFERIGDEPCLKVIVDIKNQKKNGKVDIEYRNIWLATEKKLSSFKDRSIRQSHGKSDRL